MGTQFTFLGTSMLFLGYKIYLIWSQKSTYYTIYFIFLNYLHICTAIIISYESKCYKCADSVQMKTNYEIVLSGLCILINKISKTIKTFFVLEHCINKISHSHKASIFSWISWFLDKNTCSISTGYHRNHYRMTPRNRATKERQYWQQPHGDVWTDTLNSILTEDATEINKFKNINPSLLYHIVWH